jgi:hypothetical protein
MPIEQKRVGTDHPRFIDASKVSVARSRSPSLAPHPKYYYVTPSVFGAGSCSRGRIQTSYKIKNPIGFAERVRCSLVLETADLRLG